MVSDGSRTLVASVPLAGCASNYGNLQWSELGQALVVTQESLFVLSPIFALHAKLATSHALCDVECHPSWSGRFPHTCCQISAKTLLENDPTERERIAIEVDYTQVHPLFASPRWKDASWSKPGMGPHGSCLILAISSELDLLVIGAPKNSWTGDWTLLHAVDFSPVAQQVSLNLLGGSADKLHDAPRMAFSRSRALKRKRQSAAEVLCATWADAPQMPRRSLVTRRDGTDPLHGSFAFVIAGTRSGHIAVWECHAGTGRCFLASVSSVSSSPVEQLLLGTSPGVCEDGAQGRLVFQDSQGLRLCNFYAMEDHALAELCNSQPSRLSQLGFRMVSNWKWFEHQLVFTTVGRAHVYDFRTDSITTYLFTVGTAETDADPYLPAISISAEVHAQSFTVVLQDLHHYHLLAIDGGDDGNNQDIRVAAQSPDELLGYPPLVADLQSQHDSLQAYHGLEFEPASTRESPHRMQASTLMDEHAAFLGFKVSETSKFHLMLIKNGATEIQALVASALKSAGVGVGSGRPPVTSIHALIASVLVAEDRKTALCELDFAVKKEAERIAAHNSDGKDDGGALAADRQLMLRAQNQALFCIYAWLQRQDEIASNVTTDFGIRDRQATLVAHVSQWLPALLLLRESDAYGGDRATLVRLAAAANLIASSGTFSQMSTVRDQALAGLGLSLADFSAQQVETVPGIWQMETEEQCAACCASLSLVYSETTQSFDWAKCKNSHIWPRCSITLAAMSDPTTRACTCCWAKSLVPGGAGQSEAERSMLEAASRCIYCGSCWVVP